MWLEICYRKILNLLDMTEKKPRWLGKKQRVIQLLTALERIYSSYFYEFDTYPKTLFEPIIQNTKWVWVPFYEPWFSVPCLEQILWLDTAIIARRLTSAKWIIVEDYSYENLILRWFKDELDIMWLRLEQWIKTLYKQQLYVPFGAVWTNSQDELIICPWIK